MTLLERINKKKKQGYIEQMAESIVGQEIIIEAISASSMVDRVLLKGGIVMYNITSNARRATRDLDFDLIRYDISRNENIDLFIDLLNKAILGYSIKRVDEIITLHQEDYHGRRTFVEIKDSSYDFRIKLDIGVHTLFAVEQNHIEFNVDGNDEAIIVLANPVDQMIGEKLYSLAKHGVLSTRYKDIFDIYYLIQNQEIDKQTLKNCLSLLVECGDGNVKDVYDLCDRIEYTFQDKRWYQRFITSDQDWIDEKDYQKILDCILDYIYKI